MQYVRADYFLPPCSMYSFWGWHYYYSHVTDDNSKDGRCVTVMLGSGESVQSVDGLSQGLMVFVIILL